MKTTSAKWTDTRACGDVLVSRDALEAALGRSAALVWHVLLSLRAADGSVWCGQSYLAERCALAPATVKRALGRLYRVGLVAPLGWSPAPRSLPGRAPGPVYGRRVWGRLGAAGVRVPRAVVGALSLSTRKSARATPGAGRPRPHAASLPELARAVRAAQSRVRRAVARAARALPRRAGADAAQPGAPGAPAPPGAAHPGTVPVRRPCVLIDDYDAIVRALGPCPGPRTRFAIAFKQTREELGIDRFRDLPRLFHPSNLTWMPLGTVRARARGSAFGAWSRLDDGDESGNASPPDGAKQNRPRRVTQPVPTAQVGSSDVVKTTTSVTQPTTSSDPQVLTTQERGNPFPTERDGADGAAPATAGFPSPATGSGDTGSDDAHLGGGAVPALRGLLTMDGEVPPYPTTDLIPPVRMPAMPKIPEAAGDVEKVVAIVRAYQAAVTHAYGDDTKARWVYARGVHPKVKNFHALKNCAELCMEHDISPHGWAAFSIDNWKARNGPGGKPPPITFVFNRSRLQRQHGWYRSHGAEYVDARVELAPLHRLLLVRWMHLQTALVSKQPASVQGVRAIVSRYFPGDTFNTMVERARQESKMRTAMLQDAVTGGRWVW